MDNRVILEQFIVSHQARLFGFVRSRVDNDADTGDILHNVFEKALSKIVLLRDNSRMNSWMLAIAANEISAWYRKNSKYVSFESFDDIPDEAVWEYDNFMEILKLAIKMLTPGNRDVLQLRYYSGLSYSGIAAVCGISEAKVKSRLCEAKKYIKKYFPELGDFISKPLKTYRPDKEKLIMNDERFRKYSGVFCRLSHHHQMKIAVFMAENREFDEDILSAIGLCEGGTEFVKEFHSRIMLHELVGILNYVDRFTETRLVDGLEKTSPETAEMIKQNMFVFEDFVLVEADALALVFKHAEERDILTAMCSVPRMIKDHILLAWPEKDREGLLKKIGALDADRMEIFASQQRVISILQKLVDSGEVVVKGEFHNKENPIRMCLNK